MRGGARTRCAAGPFSSGQGLFSLLWLPLRPGPCPSSRAQLTRPLAHLPASPATLSPRHPVPYPLPPPSVSPCARVEGSSHAVPPPLFPWLSPALPLLFDSPLPGSPPGHRGWAQCSPVGSQNPLGFPSDLEQTGGSQACLPSGAGALWIRLCDSYTPALCRPPDGCSFFLPATMDSSAPPPTPTSALPTSGLIPCPPLTTVSWARPTPAVLGECTRASWSSSWGRAVGTPPALLPGAHLQLPAQKSWLKRPVHRSS